MDSSLALPRESLQLSSYQIVREIQLPGYDKKLSQKKLRKTLNVNKYQITICTFKYLMHMLSTYLIYAITDNIGLFTGFIKLNQIKDLSDFLCRKVLS